MQDKYPGILRRIYVEDVRDQTREDFKDVLNIALPANGQMAGDPDSYFISKAI